MEDPGQGHKPRRGRSAKVPVPTRVLRGPQAPEAARSESRVRVSLTIKWLPALLSLVRLHFATRNPHKLAEARQFLSPHEVVQLEVAKVELKSDRLEDIATFAAERIRESFDRPFFVEDSGLFVEALNGFPGPYSSGIFRQIGLEGLLKLMRGASNRTATFRSVIAFSMHETEIELPTGEVRGSIAREPRGDRGFDYDPVFVTDEGDGRTYGEMSTEEKNAVSHRGRALRRLRAHIQGMSG